jgi:hypothetical protein
MIDPNWRADANQGEPYPHQTDFSAGGRTLPARGMTRMYGNEPLQCPST